MIPSQVHDDV